MTLLELVRLYFPDASEDKCDFIIWEKTAYPFASWITLERQLEEFKLNLEFKHKKA